MKRVARACFGLDRAGFALALAALLLAAGAARAGQVFQLSRAEWQVTPGGSFEPPPPLPPLAEDAWRPATLPHQVPRGLEVGPGDAIDTAWFRIEVPAGSRASLPTDLALYLPRWQVIGQLAVYVNSQPVWRSRGGPVWNGFNHPVWIDLGPVHPDAPLVIIVRLDHQRGTGLSLTSLWLGGGEALAWKRLAREAIQAQLTFVASTAFLVIGLLALLVWVARRESAYGLFFVCSALFFVRALHYHVGLEPLPVSEAWFGWWTVQSLPILAIAVNVLSLRLAGQRLPWIERPALALALASAVLGLPPLAAWSPAQVAPLLYLATIAGFAAFCVAAIVATSRAATRDGLILAVWNTVSIPAGVHDWLLQHHRVNPEGMFLLPFTSIGLFAVFLFIVLARYVQALRTSEQAQQQLERDLRARESELRATYDRLREAERLRILGAERERLMQDMHDGLGSSLMSALKTAEHRRLDDLAETLRQCVDDLKLAIDSMEPVEADLLVLLGTLRFRIGTRLEQAGIPLRWDVQEDLPRLAWLDPSASLQVLRILQEVFTNILKHSGARTALVTTHVAGDDIVVGVEDDGGGFDPTLARQGSRGLANVRRRAQALGGSAHWASAPGLTRFELHLPLARAAAPEVPAVGQPA